VAHAGIAERPVLVAPAPFGGDLRAPVVAAALGRGLELAGLVPPDLCPLSGGGAGTIEVLLPALGGEVVADGVALAEDGALALIEPGRTPAETAARTAAGTGAAVVVVCAVGADAAHAAAAARAVRGARLVALRAPWERLEVAGAVRESGPRFVLDALDADARLLDARAVVVGAARLDDRWLEGAVAGELATRARQRGVPCHAVVGEVALDAFGARMLDLQRVLVARDGAALEAAAASLVEVL
jgi:glycerate kinase